MSVHGYVPTPDRGAYCWVLTRPESEAEAADSIRATRLRTSFAEYRAWHLTKFGRTPLFDGHDGTIRRPSAHVIEWMGVEPEDLPRVVAHQRVLAKVLRACAVPYLFWSQRDAWDVAASCLINGWAGTDRQLYLSVNAATGQPTDGATDEPDP